MGEEGGETGGRRCWKENSAAIIALWYHHRDRTSLGGVSNARLGYIYITCIGWARLQAAPGILLSSHAVFPYRALKMANVGLHMRALCYFQKVRLARPGNPSGSTIEARLLAAERPAKPELGFWSALAEHGAHAVGVVAWWRRSPRPPGNPST